MMCYINPLDIGAGGYKMDERRALLTAYLGAHGVLVSHGQRESMNPETQVMSVTLYHHVLFRTGWDRT